MTDRIKKIKVKVKNLIDEKGEANIFVREIQQIKKQRETERTGKEGYKNYLNLNTETINAWKTICD